MSKLNEVLVISHSVHRDKRGTFQKIYTRDTNEHLDNIEFSESAFSTNLLKGTIRGLHFKIFPSKEWKLVTCVSGKIFDVVIDIRENSSAYGTCYTNELSHEAEISLLIPPGFAHGYQTLVDNSYVHYQLSEAHNSEFDKRLHWNDPFLRINWPEIVSQVSDLDTKASLWPVKY